MVMKNIKYSNATMIPLVFGTLLIGMMFNFQQDVLRTVDNFQWSLSRCIIIKKVPGV